MDDTDFLSTYKKINEVKNNGNIFALTNDLLSFLKSKNIILKEKKIDKIIFYDDAIVESNIAYLTGNQIQTMGSYSYSNSRIPYGISIGRYCSIGSNLQIFGADHFLHWVSTSPHLYSKEFQNILSDDEVSHISRSKHKINIGHDVWIGQNVTLKKCINIADGSVIGAGAIVTHDTEPFSINAGVPAKIIGYRFAKKIIDTIMKLQWWKYDIKDLKNMHVDNPALFCDLLQKKINEDDIEQCKPECVIVEDIKNFSFWYKYYISNIPSIFSDLIYSRDYSKNYYQIYIKNVDKRIHYKLINTDGIIYLTLEFELQELLNSKTERFLRYLSKKYPSSNITLKNDQYSIAIPTDKDNFAHQFSTFYNDISKQKMFLKN